MVNICFRALASDLQCRKFRLAQSPPHRDGVGIWGFSMRLNGSASVQALKENRATARARKAGCTRESQLTASKGTGCGERLCWF